jgi:TRAP transporter TAXI family solute receptor
MPKRFKFTGVSLRDLLITIGPMTVLIALLCYAAYKFIDPFPPSRVTMSTGQENSSYAAFGKRYAQILGKYDIDMTLLASQGSQENLQRLSNPDSGVDIAFVQSGSIEQEKAEKAGLVSIGSLFTEPVWLFYREDRQLDRLTQLHGMKVNVGVEGSGVPRLFRDLLAANNLHADDVELSTLDDKQAFAALRKGRIDAAAFSSAPNNALIQKLLRTPGVRLFDFAQAEAYTRRLPYLTQVTLPRGIVDLGHDLPARNVRLIAPTATLVARESLHPALIDLFAQAAVTIHGRSGWFRRQGEFPNASYNEIPVVPQAAKLYREGPPFLQRYVPFAVANFFERMWIVIVALGALLLPLSRVVPPLYVWKVRSRIYRWYGQLRVVEQAIEEVPPAKRAEAYPVQLQRLVEIEEKVNQVSIPLSFADELYRLRSHIDFVRQRITRLGDVRPDAD